MTLYLLISGRVTGVGFRFWAKRTADSFGLTGWVRNLSNGLVEIMVSGDKKSLEVFLEKCRRGPMFAKVNDIKIEWKEESLRQNNFEILE